MKRKLYAFILSLMLASILAGCGLDVPRPEVKEGRFHFTATYELNGEVKTISDAYICKYDGIGWALDGDSYYRDWVGYFENGMEGDVLEICTTEDGGKISLVFNIYPEYFMGEPDYIDDFAPNVYLQLIYFDDETGEIVEIVDDAQLIETYGVKFIGFEYDDPIENAFHSLFS